MRNSLNRHFRITVCHSSAFPTTFVRSIGIKIINYSDSITANLNDIMQTKQLQKKPHISIQCNVTDNGYVFICVRSFWVGPITPNKHTNKHFGFHFMTSVLLLQINAEKTAGPLLVQSAKSFIKKHINAKPRRWRSGLERWPRVRNVRRSNPSRDRPKSLKRVETAPLLNARQYVSLDMIINYKHKPLSQYVWHAKEPLLLNHMAMSVELRSKFAALHR